MWRVILTDADRHAITVTRVPRARPRPGLPGTVRNLGTTCIIGRVTIVLPADALDTAPASHPRLADGIYARILAAARRARDHAR